jgi:hypothetical protein
VGSTPTLPTIKRNNRINIKIKKFLLSQIKIYVKIMKIFYRREVKLLEEDYRVVKQIVRKYGEVEHVDELTMFQGKLSDLNARFSKKQYKFSTIMLNENNEIRYRFQVWSRLRWKTIPDPRD